MKTRKIENGMTLVTIDANDPEDSKLRLDFEIFYKGKLLNRVRSIDIVLLEGETLEQVLSGKDNE